MIEEEEMIVASDKERGNFLTFLVGSDRPRVTFYKSLLTGFRKLKP